MKTLIPYLQNNKEPTWQYYRCLSKLQFPSNMNWLLNPNSTTQQMRRISDNYKVLKLQQGWDMMSKTESLALKSCHGRLQGIVREVEIYCDEQIWMYGRTVIPKTTLTGKERRLLALGNQSIGEILFADPTLVRSEFEVAKIKYQDEDFWGRRSFFFVSGKPLLMTEIFMPAMMNYFSGTDV